MYAIFASGGKQHRVEVGSLIDIEKLNHDVGETVTFSTVLAIAGEDGQLQTGTPYLENTSVTGEVIQQGRAKKVIVFKSKRRKGYKRKLGHRQAFTRVKITAIGGEEAIAAEEAITTEEVEPQWHIKKEAGAPKTDATASENDSVLKGFQETT